MSGHSKFANIKHKKEKNDAAKGKIFTMIGREIAVAVKEGGPDPANNFKLAQVIAKAKSNNMPNDTIERGIKKAAGDGNSVNYEMMLALDAGAEDFSDADDSFEITTAPEDFDAVHKALEEQNIPMASAEVTMIPQTYVTLTDEADITNIGRILDFLDDDDDVQEVYHNWEE